jgi:hypothetical protein
MIRLLLFLVLLIVESGCAQHQDTTSWRWVPGIPYAINAGNINGLSDGEVYAIYAKAHGLPPPTQSRPLRMPTYDQIVGAGPATSTLKCTSVQIGIFTEIECR